MAVLSASAIQEKLKSLPEWKLEGGEIVRLYTFTDFLHSLQFVNKVRLALISHDAGGLTDADFELAAACDLVFVPAQ